jgi:hypothetical protein
VSTKFTPAHERAGPARIPSAGAARSSDATMPAERISTIAASIQTLK